MKLTRTERAELESLIAKLPPEPPDLSRLSEYHRRLYEGWRSGIDWFYARYIKRPDDALWADHVDGILPPEMPEEVAIALGISPIEAKLSNKLTLDELSQLYFDTK